MTALQMKPWQFDHMVLAIPEDWPFWKKQLVLQNNYCITTGKWYHSLCHWMVFTQIFVSYKSVERVYISVQWKFVWEKIKISVTSAYIECVTGKRYHSIHVELTNSFLLKYRYWAFAKITASTLWKKFWTSGTTTGITRIFQWFLNMLGKEGSSLSTWNVWCFDWLLHLFSPDDYWTTHSKYQQKVSDFK